MYRLAAHGRYPAQPEAMPSPCSRLRASTAAPFVDRSADASNTLENYSPLACLSTPPAFVPIRAIPFGWDTHRGNLPVFARQDGLPACGCRNVTAIALPFRDTTALTARKERQAKPTPKPKQKQQGLL